MTDIVDGAMPEEGARPQQAEPTGSVETQLRPVLEGLDQERESQKNELLFRIAVAVLGTGALAVVGALASVGAFGAGLASISMVVYAIPPLIAAVGLGFWAIQPRQRYVSTYKSQVLPVIAGTLGSFRYEETGRIAESRLRASTLMPNFDDYKSEDKFTGTYKDVDVELAEVTLTREQGSGRDRETVTVFKGLFALLTTRRAVAGKTVLKRDAGAIANWLGEKFGGMQKIEMADPAFEKHFEVYATDPAEARALLTPTIVEGMTALSKHMGDGRLQAAFYDDQLFVMVPNSKDLFEPPSIFTSIVKDAGVARLSRELGDVLSIIDILKLNEAAGANGL